jgi:hypothetical protein
MGDFTQILNFVKWAGGLAGGTVGSVMAYHAAVQVWDDVTERMHLQRQRRLTLEHVATQNDLRGVRAIQADERGRYPLLYGKNGILRDPNNLRAFTLETVRERWPRLEELDAIARIVRAAGGWPTSATAEQMLPEGPIRGGGDGAWRTVTLRELLRTYGRPSYHRLMLGETVDTGTGERQPVMGDMCDFVHVVVTGSTGWGKSTALEAMAKQLVMAGDCDLAFVDYGVNTFGMLAEYGLYRIADTPAAAVALFRVLVQEMHRRREAMAEYPQVKRVDEYNRLAGAALRPLVVFCDEASSLLDRSSEARDLVRDLTSMGRKYGLGCVFGGTDFKVATMPSETRGNCGLRVAMHLEEAQLSRSIIRSTNAVNLVDKGRALARLPGVVGLVEVQFPIVERWDNLPARREQVVLVRDIEASGKVAQGDKVAQVIEMHEAGESDTAIAGALWHPTTYYIRRVRSILDAAGLGTQRQQQQNEGDNNTDRPIERPVVVVVEEACDERESAQNEGGEEAVLGASDCGAVAGCVARDGGDADQWGAAGACAAGSVDGGVSGDAGAFREGVS